MEELVGRLTTLDPDASASLKVIVYFDSLVEGHVGLEAFLRGAAILTGCPAGVVDPERGIRMRVDEAGLRSVFTAPPGGSCLVQPLWHPGAARVWIERAGDSRVSDAMVLERLAWGIRMTIDRQEGRLPADLGDGVETLLDPEATPGERERAAHRLHLPPSESVRVVATPPDATPMAQHALSTIMSTNAGPVRAVLEVRSRAGVAARAEEGAAAADGASGRAGIGCWVKVLDLASSWPLALTALRLTGERTPIVRADDLGALTVLAVGIDAMDEPRALPEVALIDSVTESSTWAEPTLDALSTNDSVRAAASVLGVHHSTAQSRCEQLEELLGYSLRTQEGRMRAFLGLALQRLVRTRFG